MDDATMILYCALIFSILYFIFSRKSKTKSKCVNNSQVRSEINEKIIKEPEFHVRVKQRSKDTWRIEFTNDNWDLIHKINDWGDLTWGHSPVYVYEQEQIFRSEDQAILTAKEFNTYEKCIEHNNIINRQVEAKKEYYKLNPPPIREEDKPYIPTQTNIY